MNINVSDLAHRTSGTYENHRAVWILPMILSAPALPTSKSLQISRADIYIYLPTVKTMDAARKSRVDARAIKGTRIKTVFSFLSQLASAEEAAHPTAHFARIPLSSFTHVMAFS